MFRQDVTFHKNHSHSVTMSTNGNISLHKVLQISNIEIKTRRALIENLGQIAFFQ